MSQATKSKQGRKQYTLTTTKSNHPQRLLRPVVTPNSRPISWRLEPTSPRSSVGNGPPPTLVVYAFTTPIIDFTFVGLRARPVKTPPRPVLDFFNQPGNWEFCWRSTHRGDIGVCAEVEIKHKGISAFNQNRRVRILCGFHQRDLIDHVVAQFDSVVLRRIESVTSSPHCRLLTLNLEISSSTSYFSRSPYRFLKPAASSLNLWLNSCSLKTSQMRTPLRAAFVEYAGPIPFLVVPMLLPPNSTSSSPSTSWWRSKTICARSLMKIRDRTSFKP